MSHCAECFQTDGFHTEFCGFYMKETKKPIDIPIVPEDAHFSSEDWYDKTVDKRASILAATYAVLDSGERQQFESGMVRDTASNKADIARVFDGPMLYRWAEHITKGAVKYPDIKPGVPNWTLAAGEEELTRFKKSAARHFFQWMRGDTDEDHAAACYFNINGYEYTKKQLAIGLGFPA